MLELLNKLHFEEKKTESIFIHSLVFSPEAGPAGTRARLWNRCGSWHTAS